jgi:membrane-associated protease RseP (regulator of RpoE activity)
MTTRTPAFAVIAAAVSLLTGCAAPTTAPPAVSSTAAVQTETDEQARLVLAQYRTDAAKVYVLSASILRAATEICAAGKVGPSFGVFEIDTQGLIPKIYRKSARADFGITNNVTLTYVDAQSPLATTGLKAGDEILSINGRQLATGKRGVQQFLDAHHDLPPGPAVLQFRRGADTGTATVTPVIMPRLAVRYHAFDNDINAYADGESLNVLRGLLRTGVSDDGLAMIIGHEIAHNCQQHIEAGTQNARLGALVDILAAASGANTEPGAFSTFAAKAYSQDFEREADYVGLYYLARAGRPLTEARNAFRMLSVETGGGLKVAYNSSHPSNPERFIRLQATEQEILEKIRTGKPLIPNAKK